MRTTFFVLCALWGFSHSVSAQTDLLPNTITQHLYYARYAEARTAAETAVRERSGAPGAHGYVVAMSELGRVRSEFAQYKAADTLLTKALTLLEQQNAIADSAFLKTSMWAAKNCRQLAQFGRAEQLLKRALLAADAGKVAWNETFRADLLLEYATLDAQMSRLAAARAHYKQAVTALDKHSEPKSVKLATALTNWGAFEDQTMAAYRIADTLLTKALKVLEPVAARYPVEYVAALTAQARLYGWGIPRYRESQGLLEKAAAFGERHLGTRHTQLAWTLRVLADHYTTMTPYFYRADTLNRRALAIYEGHFGLDYPSYIGSMQDISEWYGALGARHKANEWRQQAFERSLRVYGDRHPETATLMLALAETQKDAGYPLIADSLLRVTDTLYRTFYGDRHQTRVTILQKQASFASSKQNYVAADSLYHLALAEETQLNGRQSPTWWNILGRIATQNWAADKPERADSLLREAILFDKQKYGENSVDYAFNWLHLFWVYNSSASNKPLEAEKAVQKYLSIVMQALGKENFYYLFGLSQLSTTLIKQLRFEEAQKILTEREHIVKIMYGEKSSAWIDILDDQIDLVQKSRTPSEALPLRRQVIAAKQALGDQNGYLRGLEQLVSELTDLGFYTEADSLSQELLKSTRNQYGRASGDYLMVLATTAWLHYQTSEFQKMKLGLDSAAVVDKLLDHPYEGIIDKWRANYYYGIGDYKTAAQLWLQELEKDPDAGNHNKYGTMLTELGQYARADSILRVGLSKVDNEPNLEIALYCNLFDNLHYWGKQDKEAIGFIEKALALAKKTYGENHPDYATMLNSYAMAMGRLGRYEEEEMMLKKVLEIQAGNDTETATTLSNLGLTYLMLGRPQEAEKLTLQALALRERKLGADHPDCIRSKQLLADYYVSGFWKPLVADSLITLVTAYWKNRAPQSRQYADVVLLRGKFFVYTGEFDKAEACIKNAADLFSNIIGPQSWEVSNCFNELGLNFNEASRVAQGAKKKELLRLALDNVQHSALLESKQYGTERINHATHLNNIAAAYYQLGNADSATHYLLRSIALRKKLQGEDNPGSGGSYSTLSGAYEMLGRYQEAEAVGRTALRILTNTTGKESEDYIPCASGMGRIMLAQGKVEEALPYLEDARKAKIAKIKKGFGYLSSTEQIKIVHRYRPDEFYSMALDYRLPELARFGYNDALLFKGAGLRNTRTLREILAASKDSTILQRYDRYLTAEKSIAAEYRLPKDQRTRLDSLQNAARDLERELIARSADYRAYIARFEVNWQAVQAKLKPTEAAIEFVRYNRRRVIDTDTFLYAALVLRPGMEAPVFVPLAFTEQELEEALGDDKTRRKDYVDDIYGTSTRGIILVSQVGGQNLYDLIWKPLEPTLSGVKKIYFSPVGLLHRLNMGALYVADDTTKLPRKAIRLSDRYSLVQVQSTRSVGGAPTSVALDGTALLAGGINYDAEPNPSGVRASNTTKPIWSQLPNTEDELKMVKSLLLDKGYFVKSLSKSSGTATAFWEALKNKPRIVHAAVHAFFAPDASKNNRSDKSNLATFGEPDPLLRSALVFAGANASNDSLSLIKGYLKRGYLTARDIAALDLRNTELVVLSACETGLGDVQNNEGVFGLQRAFLQAGAKYILMSLWEVDDPTTAELMGAFYGKWLKESKNIRQAFEEAQAEMRAKNPKDVYSWGSFILIE